PQPAWPTVLERLRSARWRTTRASARFAQPCGLTAHSDRLDHTETTPLQHDAAVAPRTPSELPLIRACIGFPCAGRCCSHLHGPWVAHRLRHVGPYEERRSGCDAPYSC